MKKILKKSVYSIHKQIAKEQFNELKYEEKDKKQMKRAFISNYFEVRTQYKKKV